MNRMAFYDDVRKTVFRGSFSQKQFEGMERLLNIWVNYYSRHPDNILAYLLATSYHETSGTIQPIKEIGSRAYFNRYDIDHNPRKAKELGNIYPGDGYKFRGEGDVQNTGRRNARFSSERLNETFGLDVDFEAEPDMRGDPDLSAHCLFLGCIEGWWTGKKITDYITAGNVDYPNARRVVNGTDRASLIAGYAESFSEAIAKARAMPAVGNEAVVAPVTGKKPTLSTTNIAATGAAILTTGEAVLGQVGRGKALWQSIVDLVTFDDPMKTVLVILVVVAAAYIIRERVKKFREKGV